MFSKILIANRGEIAVRIARACRECGIATVAVYSDADRDSLHVRFADEAHHIGAAPSSESYLRMDRILDVARETEAEAIHPGYGFLAENAAFARACEEQGVIFIGPPSEAVALMGDKSRARETARNAGVAIVPGTEASLKDKEALSEAKTIGFPLLVKATAGGGGKGMRIVNSMDSLPSALAQARSEAESSFGDPSVYLERYVERPRHIEFQILADRDGNVVHLLERECSVQRRHQKLIEEAPSPFLDETLRKRMGEAAVAIARQAGYQNAGTVEFLVDSEHNFYFLEMNARLQVEHPVTELITGLDLVKLQIAVSAGQKLPFRQEDIRPRGWAMEFRITAEDPFQNFLPSAGRIMYLREAGGPGVRNDSGVSHGGEVTPHYDPLIAKLVVYGESREQVLVRALRAVREYRVEGIATTLPFFDRLLQVKEFLAGDVDVGFVDRNWMSEIAGRNVPERTTLFPAALAAAAVAALQTTPKPQPKTQAQKPSAWKQAGKQDQLLTRL